MNKYIGFAGGCFWGVEAYFKLVRGVVATKVGYAGGYIDFPSYKAVCSGKTGHTETCLIIYDTSQTDLETLLEHFFFIIDPTELNKQGHDEGTQYRSAVFYYDIEDKPIIIDFIDSIREDYEREIVTEVLPIMKFWDAEEYHQDYLENNPGSYCHINFSKFMSASKIDALSFLKKQSKKVDELNNNFNYKNNVQESIEVDMELKNNDYYNQYDSYDNKNIDEYKNSNSFCNNYVYYKKRPIYQKYNADNYQSYSYEDENDEVYCDVIVDFKNETVYTQDKQSDLDRENTNFKVQGNKK